MKNVYQRELEVQLLIFGLFDVIVVLLEIVSAALAAAYVAQVTPYPSPPPSGCWVILSLRICLVNVFLGL